MGVAPPGGFASVYDVLPLLKEVRSGHSNQFYSVASRIGVKTQRLGLHQLLLKVSWDLRA